MTTGRINQIAFNKVETNRPTTRCRPAATCVKAEPEPRHKTRSQQSGGPRLALGPDHRAKNHPRSEPGWTGASRGRCDKRLGHTTHWRASAEPAVVSVQRRHRDRIPVRRQRLLATECEPASHREGGVYHRDTVRFTSIDECFQTKARLTFRAWARSEAVLRKNNLSSRA